MGNGSFLCPLVSYLETANGVELNRE
jgi:hypothetical protein